MTTTKIYKIESLWFQQKPTFCQYQTLSSPCKDILASFGFLVLQSSNKNEQALNCLINRLEDEELMVIPKILLD